LFSQFPGEESFPPLRCHFCFHQWAILCPGTVFHVSLRGIHPAVFLLSFFLCSVPTFFVSPRVSGTNLLISHCSTFRVTWLHQFRITSSFFRPVRPSFILRAIFAAGFGPARERFFFFFFSPVRRSGRSPLSWRVVSPRRLLPP